MPTTRPRHTITQTEEVSRALEDAARRWPEHRERPAQLLLSLMREGQRAIAGEHERAAAERREVIARTSGALTGTYPSDYLGRLRREWPD
jgi:hypothetical protein